MGDVRRRGGKKTMAAGVSGWGTMARRGGRTSGNGRQGSRFIGSLSERADASLRPRPATPPGTARHHLACLRFGVDAALMGLAGFGAARNAQQRRLAEGVSAGDDAGSSLD
ncbi:hypothetical protein WOLCODRAFT_155852 [Wolfiporia cocos MD-104 SS10]|uniref:Uncharacterized protein n=1 Tax=Wolfiporia cocos (strain MD-104) TaxID=742152 RepID=A0A2H3JEP9_WOLCO|nr:hypothetical protein WOLCODRAFT_155852 [Wolfiporia cocos MD-104 SS10]